ncbi:MAG: hypothetical protein ACYTGN_03680 [Planctomycetota bacterium]
MALASSFALAQGAGEVRDGARKSDTKQAAAGAKKDEKSAVAKVVESLKKDQVRVLQPKDVAQELKKLKTKADIKAELTVRTTSGRPVVFKGVIRSGKLIERIVKRRFVPQETVEHPGSGVRIWWSGDTDGFIFFRYATVKTLTITGRLTEKERREIMRRLAAKRAGKAIERNRGPAKADELAKMSAAELKSYLIDNYSYAEGWNHKRMRELKRKKLIKNEVLTAEQEIFVKYFSILVEAHFESLKKIRKQIEIDTSGEPDSDSESGDADKRDGGDDKPGKDEPKKADQG